MGVATMTGTRVGRDQSVADLLLGIGVGNRSAWEELLRRYGGLVFMTARSFRLQDADTLDAVQMTWMRLMEKYHQVQSPERLGGWLVTTARRECLRILREAKRISTTDVTADNAVDLSAGPEQRAVDAATTHTLRNLLAELTPRQRTLLLALFTDNPHCYAEITRITGIPSGSIGPTRARTLARLRQKLDEHGRL